MPYGIVGSTPTTGTKLEEIMEQTEAEKQDKRIADALDYAEEHPDIKVSTLQRKFKIGFNTAMRLLDAVKK